jgi:hypothetical protein
MHYRSMWACALGLRSARARPLDHTSETQRRHVPKRRRKKRPGFHVDTDAARATPGHLTDALADVPFLVSRTCRVAFFLTTCPNQSNNSPALRPCGGSASGICYLTNRFGFELHPQDIRWAAAEGVSQDVIAAVLLLHEHSVDEIAPRLTATELEQTIVLVGRSPRLYARGTLEALERGGPRRARRRLKSSNPTLSRAKRPRHLTTAERRPLTPAPANHGDTMSVPLSEQAQAPNRGRQSR